MFAFKRILNLHFRIIFAIFIFSPFSDAVALSEKELASYDVDIFLNPAHAYEELLALSVNNNFTVSGKTWLLLRTAQAQENLMLYQDMTRTLSSLSAFIPTMNSPQKTTFHYLNGINERHNGNLTQSITQLKLAVSLSSWQPTTLPYILAVKELGYVFALSGDYYDATFILQETYKKIVDLNNPFYNGLIEESLGDTYNYLGSYQKSLEYYDGALSFFEQLAYQPYIASTLLGIAIVNRRLENWDQALTFFDRYETSLRFADGYSENFYLYYGRAMTLAEKGDCLLAISAIDYALLLSGPDDYDAELYKKRALCNVQINNIQMAHTDLIKAQNILNTYEELRETQWYLELEYIKGLIAYKEDQFKNAFDFIEEYYQNYLILQKQNNSEHMARMQATLEAERKDKQITLLRQQAKLQDVEAREQSLIVKQQHIQLCAIILVLTLLFIFAIFQYRHSRKLLALSIRDDLTGIHNRRYFFDFFDEYKNKHHPNEQPGLAIVTFDIDNFKQINDSWGHQVGDNVITTVAQIADSTLRSSDIIARIGGDEFIVALPRTSLSHSEDIANRIIQNITNHNFTLKNGHNFNVTVSVGVAYYEQNTHSPCDVEELIESADNALYKSKRAGKNRYTLAT